jgi:hypothetical protein
MSTEQIDDFAGKSAKFELLIVSQTQLTRIRRSHQEPGLRRDEGPPVAPDAAEPGPPFHQQNSTRSNKPWLDVAVL